MEMSESKTQTPEKQEAPKAAPPVENKAATPEEDSYEALKQKYITHITLRNLSRLTIRQVDQALRFFIAFLEGQGIASVHQVGREHLEAYKAYMMGYQTRKGRQLTAATVRGRLFTAQRWFKFLKKKGVLNSSPIADVQPPSRVKQLPTGIMSPEEVQKVMSQPDLKSVLGYRDRTMMEVLYATGVRAAELLSMSIPKIDLIKKTIKVKGKGGKERLVPTTSSCGRFLVRYLEVIRPELAEGIRPAGNNWRKKYQTGGDTLFLSAYGGPITNTWLGAMMKKYIRAAGITRQMSPVHGFRHAVATHLLEGGMDVRYVQSFLGHSNINSTAIYARVGKKPLRKEVQKHHPRAKSGDVVKPFKDRREGEDGEAGCPALV